MNPFFFFLKIKDFLYLIKEIQEPECVREQSAQENILTYRKWKQRTIQLNEKLHDLPLRWSNQEGRNGRNLEHVWRNEKWIGGFGGETRRKESQLKSQGIFGV